MELPLTVEAIAFDLDDTLCDSKAAQEAALRSLASAISRKSAKQESFIAAYRLHEPRLYRAVLSNHITVAEYRVQRFQQAVETCGAHPSEMAASDLNTEYSRRLLNSVHLYPEVTSVLNRLRLSGYPLALIVNGPSDTQRKKINALGIDHYFKTILISSEVRMAKPDKRIYERAADLLGVYMGGLLMVGDSIKEDYYGAINARAKAALLDRDGRLADDSGVVRIRSLEELDY